MAQRIYLAVDMGASSGRHVLGRFDGRTVQLEEVYRFENGPVDVGGRLYWDLLGQWSHVRRGLRAAAEAEVQIASVGVDTWGVDFGLLGRGDELLGNPYNYRDRRTEGVIEKACGIVPREEIFRHTGLQFVSINTLYQLLAMKLTGSPLLDIAETFLMMPDLFHWLLTGVKCNEMTEASTTQFYNPVAGGWATELLERFSLPTRILAPIAQPGTTLGPLRPSLAAESGLQTVQVVLPGSHDTASAVMAVPAHTEPGQRPDWCYISLGTWALMGIESPGPVINDAVLKLNFTNEGGVGGTIRLLKNITGLWIVQECRRVWNQAGAPLDWDAMTQMSVAAAPLRSFIDPDAPEFVAPGDMPEAIRAFCRKTGQAVPDDRGAVLRSVLEG
ncbi:MAG: rhamnulokinase family protein, partial [Thermoguttaceae bacterium]